MRKDRVQSFWRAVTRLGAAGALSVACSGALAAPTSASGWDVRCAEQGGGSCELLTEVSLEESGRTIAQLSVYRLSDSDFIVEQRLPTGAHIPSGVVSVIDGAEPFKPTLIACNAAWCIARSRATPALISAMKRGYVLSTVMVDPVSLKQVMVPFSLIGFSATLKEWALRTGL